MIEIREGLFRDDMYGMEAIFKGVDPEDNSKVAKALAKYDPGTRVTIISAPKSMNGTYRVKFPDGKKYNLLIDEIDGILPDMNGYVTAVDGFDPEEDDDNKIIDISDYRKESADSDDDTGELRCPECGCKLTYRTSVGYMCSSDYVKDAPYCLPCMETYCLSHNCFGCEYGPKSKCKFSWIKDMAIESERAEQEDDDSDED